MKAQRAKVPAPRKSSSTDTARIVPDVASEESASHALPLELQQRILNTFLTAAPICSDRAHLRRTIQEVKGHLYNRDFRSAFGQTENLQAYALRWSAARALGYASIFMQSGRSELYCVRDSESTRNETTNTTISTASTSLATTDDVRRKFVCIGGGAGAEIVALAAMQSCSTNDLKIDIKAVDNADWTTTVTDLTEALSQPARLSVHASEAAKALAENQALLIDAAGTTVDFVHQDVLDWQSESLKQTLSDCDLCTIMFTLNELFSVSLPRTTSFLLQTTQAMKPSSYLLVVDSPGSYSEVALKCSSGKEKVPAGSLESKKYPMKWLLDHTLLQVAGEKDRPAWQKLESEDSLWFRVDPEDRVKLKYPIELENMRYQLHLYRRL